MHPLFTTAILASTVAGGGIAPTMTSAATASMPGSIAPAKPAVLDRAAAEAVRLRVEKDRAQTKQWLRTGATSYLAAVSRQDFGERVTLTVGREAGNDVRLDDTEIEPRHLRVTVMGDSFRVEAMDERARFRVGERETREAVLGPTGIHVGRYLLRLSHQRFPAIIVFDPASPHYKKYKGLRYFALDFDYRYILPLTTNPEPDTVIILSTRGSRRHALRVGWFDFMVGKTPCRLEATRLLEPGVGENDLSVFFRDASTGRQTYEVGRYVNPEPLPDGRFVLDFNMAYNPACAYSDHYNCPIPPPANALPVTIRAGEMDSHYH